MDYVLLTFKAVSLIFAVTAVATGGQAVVDPVGFSASFGLAVSSRERVKAYVSLMGVRQLATGVTLLVFACQGKWTEMATILAIIGFVVAGTDGYHLKRAGARGLLHAVPGACIAALAGGALYTSSVSGLYR